MAKFGGNSQGSLTKVGRFSTVDLLVLNCLHKLNFTLKIFTFLQNKLNEEVNCAEPSLQLVFHVMADIFITGLVFLSQVQI